MAFGSCALPLVLLIPESGPSTSILSALGVLDSSPELSDSTPFAFAPDSRPPGG